MTIEALPPGLWVLNNDSIGSRDFPEASRARDLLAPVAGEPWSALAPELCRVLGDHTLPAMGDVPQPPQGSPFTHESLRSLQALCVHTAPYGTTSSTVLALGDTDVRDYRFAPGPPCVTPFAKVTLSA